QQRAPMVRAIAIAPERIASFRAVEWVGGSALECRTPFSTAVSACCRRRRRHIWGCSIKFRRMSSWRKSRKKLHGARGQRCKCFSQRKGSPASAGGGDMVKKEEQSVREFVSIWYSENTWRNLQPIGIHS